MCGGIVYDILKIKKSELQAHYSPEEIEKFQKTGKFETHFWDKNPTLPIEIDGGVSLKNWGNRDKTIKIPQTGWAKSESIDAGKWAHLMPKFVKIPAKEGIEKTTHFKIKSGALKGVMIKTQETEVVYMLTKPATPKYQKLTGHNREPVEIK